MSDVRDFLEQLKQHALNWHWVCRDYGSAYDMAFTSYKNIWNAQNESDKQKAEMVVLALSIVSSTVLMASFATNSLGVLAGRAAQHWLASNNLNKTLSVLNLIGENKPTMFALGAIGNAAEAKVKKYITDQTRALLGAPSMPAVTSPLAIQNDLMNFVDKSHYQIREVVLALEKDQRIGEAERRQIIAVLQSAPICKPPVNMLDRDKLRDHIELSLHMSALLDSDFLVTIPAHSVEHYSGTQASEFLAKRQPILELPSSNKYPKATPLRTWMGIVQERNEVRTEQPGRLISDRIDDLHVKAFKEKFSSIDTWQERKDEPKIALIKAEKTLDRLANESRPLQFDVARI